MTNSREKYAVVHKPEWDKEYRGEWLIIREDGSVYLDGFLSKYTALYLVRKLNTLAAKGGLK